jgi:hypothetical protein
MARSRCPPVLSATRDRRMWRSSVGADSALVVTVMDAPWPRLITCSQIAAAAAAAAAAGHSMHACAKGQGPESQRQSDLPTLPFLHPPTQTLPPPYGSLPQPSHRSNNQTAHLRRPCGGGSEVQHQVRVRKRNPGGSNLGVLSVQNVHAPQPLLRKAVQLPAVLGARHKAASAALHTTHALKTTGTQLLSHRHVPRTTPQHQGRPPPPPAHLPSSSP